MDGDVIIRFDVCCPRSFISRLKNIFTKECIKKSQCEDYFIKVHPLDTSDYTLQFEQARKQSHNSEGLKDDHETIETSSMSGSVPTGQPASLQRTDSTSNSTSRSVITGQAESQKNASIGNAEMVFNNPDIALKELNVNMQHALHHCLHDTEEKCPYYNDIEECGRNYDKKTVDHFTRYINGWSFKGDYEDYILDHLQNKRCGTSCPLWKFYVENKMYLKYNSLLKLADEGLVIYSKTNKDKMGKICKDYSGYENNKPIGSGGFGKVYQYTKEFAIKKEYKRPLIMANPKIFNSIIQLDNENIISVEEYLVGRTVEKGKCIFLFVMPYLNKRGLNEQFSTYKSILDYMIVYPDEEENIFDNFLNLFLQVFKGLEYLHGKKIVHGDVKDANILVQQSCTCESPFHCKCPGHIGVTYVLTDMDLLCFDGQSLTGKYVEWADMKLHEPAGTPGMKPSELYFTGEKGEPCVSSKSDVWAGCVAMMKALVGKNANDEAKIQITAFFEEITVSGKKYTGDISAAYRIVQKLQKNVKFLDLTQERPDTIPFLKKQVADVVLEFKKLKELLRNAQLVKETHHVSTYTYPAKFPLAMILSAVHVANSLHQLCLEKLPLVYSRPLWKTMKASMQLITNGVRFLPMNRPNATSVIKKLTELLLGFDDK